MMRGTIRNIGSLALLAAGVLAAPAKAQVNPATDVNPDPNIFEAYLTADEQDLTIDGVTVHGMVYRDDPPGGGGAPPGIPSPEIKVKVGDQIIIHFQNDLDSLSASIHWHGIELDNDSDGTAVTQDAVLPGQSYVYRFLTFRPGLYWYHSHMLPGSSTFAGMYGSIVIENDIDDSLKGTVLPTNANTHSLVLSDIEFDPASGVVGKPLPPPAGPITPINELVELCHLAVEGEPGGDPSACGSPTPGKTVLVNGVPPDLAAETPKFTVASGEKIRLRLFNAAITRHFRLKLINSGDNKLYRIGGEGGLLDNVQLDGGMKGTWDTKFDLGEIVIGSGERADVIVVPSGADGDIIQLVGNPLPTPFMLSAATINGNPGLPVDYPIAFFEISGTSSDTPPAAGDAILAGTAEDIEDLKDDPVVDPLVDPAPFGGSSDETIRLTNARPPPQAQSPSVDGFSSMLDSNVGNGDFLTLARPQTSRYARIGDLLEMSVRNETAAVHPFHMHGFSLQPVRVTDNAGVTLYTFDYDEFMDSIDVYGMQTLVYRARLDDRPKLCDESPTFPPGPVLAACADQECGGAVGRWLFHCHIFHHAGLGMMGEITVLESDPVPPEITCPADITTDTDPGVCSAVVNYDPPVATDDCGVPTVVCTPPPGSTFPKGTTTVTCTATDSDGLTAECTFDVTVEDNEPPTVTSSLADAMLWPPNHFLTNVGLTVVAADNCPDVVVSVSVFGDEDDESQTGDGLHSPDAKDLLPSSLRLRAERKGDEDGRVYLIVVTATDTSGNTAFACSTAVTPKGRRLAQIISVNAQAAAAKAFCEANDGASPPGYFVIGDGPILGPFQ
ncbi:MAG: multicopper oxidase domain-containing protein [Planctomycetota bacterium]